MEKFVRLCLTVFYIISIVPHRLTALECYFCAATGAGNKCEQYKPYEDANKGDDTSVLKNCTSPFDQICYIETYSDRGGSVTHIRDCGDGTSFSYIGLQQNIRGMYESLTKMDSNNYTRCIFDGIYQVCLTKCVEDLCNGPQFVNAARDSRDKRLYIVNLLFFVMLWQFS